MLVASGKQERPGQARTGLMVLKSPTRRLLYRIARRKGQWAERGSGCLRLGLGERRRRAHALARRGMRGFTLRAFAGACSCVWSASVAASRTAATKRLSGIAGRRGCAAGVF
jgi:hypothetical protein